MSEVLSQIEVSIEEVLEHIDKLNSNESPGPDGIHPEVLKELRYKIAELLAVVAMNARKSPMSAAMGTVCTPRTAISASFTMVQDHKREDHVHGLVLWAPDIYECDRQPYIDECSSLVGQVCWNGQCIKALAPSSAYARKGLTGPWMGRTVSESEMSNLVIQVNNMSWEDVTVVVSARPLFELLDGNVVFFWFKCGPGSKQRFVQDRQR
ncbi:unnamed protein product [Lepidochelys olivacea]